MDSPPNKPNPDQTIPKPGDTKPISPEHKPAPHGDLNPSDIQLPTKADPSPESNLNPPSNNIPMGFQSFGPPPTQSPPQNQAQNPQQIPYGAYNQTQPQMQQQTHGAYIEQQPQMYGYYNQQPIQPKWQAQQQYQLAGWNPEQFQNNGYRQWQMPKGYQFQATFLNRQNAMDSSGVIFHQYDRDANGKLDINEAPIAIQAIYSQVGKYPNQNDVMFALREFDEDRNGYLTIKEFQRLVRYISGNRKSNKKGKKQKLGKEGKKQKEKIEGKEDKKTKKEDKKSKKKYVDNKY